MANIVNITATFSIEGPMKIPNSAKFKYYMTKKSKNMIEFPGAIYKKYGHTFILFKTGKIICIGGKEIEVLENICTKVAKIINDSGKIYNFEIRNLVSSLNTGTFLDLDSSAESIKSKKFRICYDPELFAALLIYTENCLVILFHTGKVIFTGVKTQENIYKAWETIKHHLIWK